MRELLKVPNATLRTICRPVKEINSEVEALANDLIDYMLAHCEDEFAPISLAAPQFGELIRVIAFFPNRRFKERTGIEVLINPELVKARDYILLTETCLSVPRKTYLVRRAKSVKVRGLTLHGRLKSYKAADLFAQALQHEINHLDGILIDKIGKLVK